MESSKQFEQQDAPRVNAPAHEPRVDQNTALNNMVHFLNVAQKRGVFSFEESSKIWDCLKAFGAK
jgi:hypothetical protein